MWHTLVCWRISIFPSLPSLVLELWIWYISQSCGDPLQAALVQGRGDCFFREKRMVMLACFTFSCCFGEMACSMSTILEAAELRKSQTFQPLCGYFSTIYLLQTVMEEAFCSIVEASVLLVVPLPPFNLPWPIIWTGTQGEPSHHAGCLYGWTDPKEKLTVTLRYRWWSGI